MLSTGSPCLELRSRQVWYAGALLFTCFILAEFLAPEPVVGLRCSQTRMCCTSVSELFSALLWNRFARPNFFCRAILQRIWCQSELAAFVVCMYERVILRSKRLFGSRRGTERKRIILVSCSSAGVRIGYVYVTVQRNTSNLLHSKP